MRWVTFCLLMCMSAMVDAVNIIDVHKAIDVVSTKLSMPVIVEMADTEDPLAATWKPSTGTCHIYVSNDNLEVLVFMTLGQRKDHMLEGFVAHELAHCYELRQLTLYIGAYATYLHMMNLTARVRAELTGDIVAIMYWQQEYPSHATRYTRQLLEWRRLSQHEDKEHATFPYLFYLVPNIPSVVNMQEAIHLRDKYYDKIDTRMRK